MMDLRYKGYGFIGDADSRNLTLSRQVVGELVVEEVKRRSRS